MNYDWIRTTAKGIYEHKIIALLFAVVLVVISLYLINAYAKNTFLKPFYDQAALAEAHLDDVAFGQRLASYDTKESASNRGINLYANCSALGTYRNYETNKTINDAYTCMKGKIVFYNVETLDKQSVKNAQKTMTDNGWTLNPESIEFYDATIDYIVSKNRSPNTLNFSRSDKTRAIVWFITKPSKDDQFQCGNVLLYCNKLARDADDHDNYIAVQIYAYKGYE